MGQWQAPPQQWATKLGKVQSHDSVPCTLSGNTVKVPLVSHFQFSISVRKIRKNEKLKFHFYNSTPKEDLQHEACIVNLHIHISANFFSFLLDHHCRDTLSSITDFLGLKVSHRLFMFMDTQYNWSKTTTEFFLRELQFSP